MFRPGLCVFLSVAIVGGLYADLPAPSASKSGVKALLISCYYDRLARAAKTLQSTVDVGSLDEGNDFALLPMDGAHLVGIAVNVSDEFGASVIAAIQPIFESREGRSRGQAKGKAVDSLSLFVEAKPGYVVSELLINATGNSVRGIKVIFRRLDISHQTLIAGDKYESEWLGRDECRELARVGDKTRPAIGLAGRASDWVASLGLLQAP